MLAVAAELGYKPNLLARGLRGSRSSLLGVIARDISDPFHIQILRGINEASRVRDYRLFLGHVDYRPDVALSYSSMFESSHADGIIVIGDIDGGDDDPRPARPAAPLRHRRHGPHDPPADPGRLRRRRRRHAAGARASLGARPSLDHLRVGRADLRRSPAHRPVRAVHARARGRPTRSASSSRTRIPSPSLELGRRIFADWAATGASDRDLRHVGHDRDRASCRPPTRPASAMPGRPLDRRLRRHRRRGLHDPAADHDQPGRRRDGADVRRAAVRHDRQRAPPVRGRRRRPRRRGSSCAAPRWPWRP